MRIETFIKKVYGWLRREPVVMIKRARYKTWLSWKQFSFVDREEKIKRVEKILKENSSIYFTTGLVKTGFTDQLIGFDFLYKLGRGLGLNYFHIPLSTDRSSDPFLHDPISQSKINRPKFPSTSQDIFDYLGLNEYLKKQFSAPPKIDKNIPLNLDLTLFDVEGITNFESVLEEMKVILYPFLKSNKSILFNFHIEPKTYFKYFRFAKGEKMFGIDYSSLFEQSMGSDQRLSEFGSDTTNILVHIRQGDTGTIETPWNTFIPVWHEIEGKFRQFDEEEKIPGHKRIYPEQFYQFLKDLQENLSVQNLSSVVFSDGYKKTFRWIYKSSREKDISAEEIEKLKMLEPDYDLQKFNMFDKLPNTHTVIGEEVDKLHRLIHSYFDADILITGTQATLIPKMKTIYEKENRIPLLILLYHTKKPSLEYVGLRNTNSSLLFVNINNYNIAEISSRVGAYLELEFQRRQK